MVGSGASRQLDKGFRHVTNYYEGRSTKPNNSGKLPVDFRDINVVARSEHLLNFCSSNFQCTQASLVGSRIDITKYSLGLNSMARKHVSSLGSANPCCDIMVCRQQQGGICARRHMK